ncbi:PEP-CTERM sorting domain-containing protein [Rubritalea tangerina]|uniref:PEP-CTERM sorting domain-containing protein n=1 Tax=Rubritalea tangerina TaxID=430798 RepID=A0ABW4ZEF5_9BACT
MKKTTSVIAVALLSSLWGSAATIDWSGVSGTFTDAGNWTGGVAPVLDGTDNARVSSGSAIHNGTGGDLTISGGSQLILNGGDYGQTAGFWLNFQGGGSFSVTNGSTLQGTNNLRLRGVGGNAATHTVDGGFVNANAWEVDDNQTVNISNGSVLSMNGTSSVNNNSVINLTASTLNVNNLDLRTYAGNSGFVNLFDGAQLNVNGAFTTTANAFVNFDTDSTAVMFLDNVSVTDVETLITNGQFGISGAIDTTTSNYALSVNGSGVDVQLVAIPEPSVSALLGLGGVALILRRRK